MISERNVIKVLMPYPNLSADLAVVKHYYICNKNHDNHKLLLKCQTFKMPMLNRGIAEFNQKFFRIPANNNTTPFIRDTVVDKQKIFELMNVRIPLSYLCTENPKEIPKMLYFNLLESFRQTESIKIHIEKTAFIRLNSECE